MKKYEVIITALLIAFFAAFLGYLLISSKIARAENQAKKEREERVVIEANKARERQLAAEELERLKDDLSWVKTQDKLPFYERFAERFANHPEIDSIRKRIIDLEVKRIAAGEYGEMPKAQSLSSGGSFVEVEVENKTGYILTIRYSGPDSQKVLIPIGVTTTVSLPPGDYQVAASVSASNVTNYFGRDSMKAGKYSSSFYIQSQYR